MMSSLILFNKPFNVLSQFTDGNGRPTLANYIQEKHFYPAGRLDKDSEGLLILTNDGALQQEISNPAFKLAKTYWVQVEGMITLEALAQLQQGVLLKDGKTRPAKAEIIKEPLLWQRNPPIRSRKNIPTSWLALTIREGKNRQVRRMTASVGYPTLRLIRYSIGKWNLKDMQPGEFVKLQNK